MSTESSLPPPSVDIEDMFTNSSSSSFVPIDETNIQDAIQVINEHKEFNDDILSYIQKTTSSSIGNNYHIISVFGSQSTGKSTLLNRLFNTNFDVMDESNRQQTTKGIWMAHSPLISANDSNVKAQENVFVMDVEGTDGRERGEDQDFERKAALFALSTSEILIINIWEHQIGLYQGANMGLLKTVFEVNLSLFGKSKLDNSNNHKVLLLFVIRDHIGNTPKDSLSKTINQDLEKMWDNLSKPAELAQLQFSDFFDLDFHTLSHKVLQPEQFISDVRSLGDRINTKDDLFKPYYHHNIPVDGWTMYAANCWDQIDNNKDLDLPTQQILVAKFKCDEISKTVFEEFLNSFEAAKNKSSNIITEENIDYEAVGKSLIELVNEPLNTFDVTASRYNQTVYEQKRNSLCTQLHTKLKDLTNIYIQNFVELTIKDFKFKLSELKGKNFRNEVEKFKKESLDSFAITANLLSVNNKIFFEEPLDALNVDLNKNISKQQTVELGNILQKSLKKLNNSITRAIQSQLTDPSEDTWDIILGKFNISIEDILSKYRTSDGYDFELGTTEDTNLELITKFKFKGWNNFYEISRKLISKENLLSLLKEKFDDKFRYDENGLPKLYQNTRELEISYQKAKSDALNLLPILSFAKLSNSTEILPEFDIFDTSLREKYLESNEKESNDSDFDSDDENTTTCFAEIVTEKDKASILTKFKKEADARFIETKRSIIQHVTQIPYYIYLVILVLGWNEFLAIIRNPFFFTLTLLCLAIGFVLYQLDLLAPATYVVQKLVHELLKAAKEKLREFLIDDHGLHAKNLGKMSNTDGSTDSQHED